MPGVSVTETYSGRTQNITNPRFLLSNNGSFCLFSATRSVSAWEGVYFFDSDEITAHKVLHEISHDQEITGLEVSPEYTLRKSRGLEELFLFKQNAFCYQARGTAVLRMLLDIREANDYATDDRFHDLQHIDKYTFKISGKDKEYFLRCSQPIILVDEWTSTKTDFDARRQANDQWWVHERVQLHCHDSVRLVISSNKKDLNDAWNGSWDPLVSDKPWPQVALEQLTVDTALGPGILAGFPWFTQIWTRDEAISLHALMDIDAKRASQILLRQVQRIDEYGHIPNRAPGADLGSADGVGWVFARLHELYKKFPEQLSEEQWKYCYNQLCISLDNQFTQCLEDGLVVNKPKETWMDTEGSTDDLREGACIEIQALTLRSLQLAVDLADHFNQNPAWWQNKHDKLLSRVREEFFKDGILYDRKGDPTQRPNAFIALYVYPALLNENQAVSAIRHSLNRLWLPWGGLSTIDTSHQLFCPYHTGMHDDSYHRGDSWYWVNVLASIVLCRYADEFLEHIEKLRSAAKQDLLWQGVIGHPSEISSANEQESFGCFSQAWSAAMILESRLK